MTRLTGFAFAFAVALAACGSQPSAPGGGEAKAAAPAAPSARIETAVFAGGCFWCTEADFEKLPGVTGAISGYIGGRTRRPSYEQVSAGGTGHYEAVRITYDPKRVSYRRLVDHYFRTVDPLDAGGQFCDRGESYRTAIFVAGPNQRKVAEAGKAAAARTLGKPLATAILPAGPFWPAEGYHQDYYKKHSLKYSFYRGRCGRDARLREVWGGK